MIYLNKSLLIIILILSNISLFSNNCADRVQEIFDKIIFMKAPSFKFVLNWRLKQEKMNNFNHKNHKRMSEKEILYFISHYEKITKWMIKTMPAEADMVIKINQNQMIKKIIYN